MIESLESTKIQYEFILQDKNTKYNTKKDALIQKIKEQETLEIETTISKIKQKYKKKYDNIDSVIEGHMTNDNRRVEALGKKIQILEASISKMREKLMEEKKSKTLFNAESDIAILKNEINEIRAEITRIMH
jgi:hypothetical protein